MVLRRLGYGARGGNLHREDGLLGELVLLHLVEEVCVPRALDVDDPDDAAVPLRHGLGQG